MAEAARRRGRGSAWLAVLTLWVGWGCSSVPAPVAYDYFRRPHVRDPWSGKIHQWQERERSDAGEDVLRAPAAVAGPGGDEARLDGAPEDLQEKYLAFRAERKRALAREIAAWVQEQAQQHYVPDGPVDRWATLNETLRRNGDDCDGLELLTYHLLRDLGFPEQEVFRAIVYRRDDGQHHMVTLWFETPDDPWVIDPTGAMTPGMPRMSQVPGWVPLKVFSEEADYDVSRTFADVTRR